MTDKTIDLLVKANVQGKKDLDSVAKSISAISGALDEQGSAAKRGQKNLDEIQGSMAALAIENKKLGESLKLLNAFEKSADQINRTEAAVGKAKKAYEAFTTQIEKTGAATADQLVAQNKLSATYNAAEARLVKYKNRQAELAASLREIGLAGDDLAGSQARLRSAMEASAAVVAKGSGIISTYATDVRAARDVEAKANAAAIASATEYANKIGVINAQVAAARKAQAAAQAAADAQKAADEKAANAAAIAGATEYANKLGIVNAQIAAARKKQADAQALVDAQKAVDSKLSKLASDAELATEKFTTLARASTNLRPTITSLRDAVNQIVNPAQEARKTLAGVEAEVGTLGTTIGKIRGPVTDYKSILQQLETAQKAIGRQSGLVDDFNQQVVALRAARAEFAAARTQVAQYAAEVRQGGSAGQAFVTALSEAQVRARGASAALASQIGVTRESRDALRAAGIAANELGDAERRLAAAAAGTVASTKAVTDAVHQYGTAAADAGKKKLNLWTGDADGGRTTLSLLQRIKGEVLSLTASYAGLFGAIGTAKGALDAFSTREGAKNQLGISIGNDRTKIDAEYNYVKGQSDRIGIEFERAIKGYAKFSAAATLAGRGRQEVRYIFETFSEVGRVANLSADDLDGVFKAIEQIFSKGKIQAEELRGQLGDRLFGAFQIAAKSLKDQFPDIDKAMKDGLITSDQLVLVAAEYKRIIADELPGAMQSMAAQQMRMNNAVFDFKLAVADSGWADAYKKAIIVLSDFMRSADGIDAAQKFSKALAALAEGFIAVIENIDTVKTVLTALLTLFAAKQIVGFISLLGAASAEMKVLSYSAGLAAGSVMKFAAAWPLLTTAATGALGIISAAFIGWEIGTWAYEKFDIVKEAGIGLVTGMDYVWNLIKGGFSMLFAGLPSIARNAFAGVINLVTLGARNLLGIFAKLAGAAGLGNLEKTLNSAADSLKIGYADVAASIAAERAKMEGELSKIKALRDDMLADVRNPKSTPAKSIAKGHTYDAATDKPDVTRPKVSKPVDEAALKHQQSLIDEMTRAIEAITAKIDRSQTESLAAQLDAIEKEYQKLRRKVALIGGKTGEEFMARLNEAVNGLKEQTTKKFNKGLEDDFKSLTAELANAEAAAGRKQKDSLIARQEAIKQSYTGLYQKIEDMRAKYAANQMLDGVAQAENAKLSLDSYIKTLQELEATKVAKEKLTQLEASMNDLIKSRDAQLAAVNAKKEVGALNDSQAADELNRINAEAVSGIQAAGAATREWAMANQGVFANTTDRDTFIATLDAVIAKQGQIKTAFNDIETAALKGAVDGINAGLNSVVDNLQQVFNGQKSMAAGFDGVLQAFGQFAAKFLRDIAMMIIQQQIFNMMAASGGGTGTIASIGKMALGIKHDGGIVGENGAGNRTRMMDPSWFAAAPRYHSGGVPGLRADEYATILQKGEEVLAKDSPRNVMNGATMATPKAPDGQGIRVVMVDDRSKVHEAMASSDGERVIVQAIRRNIPSVKQMLR